MQTETARQTRDYRIASRVTGAHKSLFERAATLQGISLSDFMVRAAYDAAIRALQEGEILLHLSPANTRFLVEELLNPVGDPAVETPNLYRAFQDIAPAS